MVSADRPHDELADEENPTVEETAQILAATALEAEAVDAMVLRQCSPRFLKVAMVVGKLLSELDDRFPHLPYAYLQARMQELEGAGVVEIVGNVWSMRDSEIRLVSPASDA